MTFGFHDRRFAVEHRWQRCDLLRWAGSGAVAGEASTVGRGAGAQLATEQATIAPRNLALNVMLLS